MAATAADTGTDTLAIAATAAARLGQRRAARGQGDTGEGAHDNVAFHGKTSWNMVVVRETNGATVRCRRFALATTAKGSATDSPQRRETWANFAIGRAGA
jgi:hypothetical protein